MSQRPGPVSESVAAFQRSLVSLVRDCIEDATARGELPAETDPAELVLQIQGLILAANTGFVLSQDPGVLDVARRSARRLLGPG